MTVSTLTTGDRTAGRDRAPVDPALLDVRAVAALLDCAPRTVYRLADAGRLPTPVRLGNLVRWSAPAIERWIAEGCPTVRTVTAKGGAR